MNGTVNSNRYLKGKTIILILKKKLFIKV